MQGTVPLRTRLAVAGAVLVALLAVLTWQLWPKDTLTRLRAAFPNDCASITESHLSGYRGAEKSVWLRCEALGPVAYYIRFSTAKAALAAVRTRAAREDLNCVKGRELVSSSRSDFSPAQFRHVCSEIGGHLVGS